MPGKGDPVEPAPDGVDKLIETNTQIVSRNAERFQGSAERATREIQDAVSTCAGRLRELYSARS